MLRGLWCVLRLLFDVSQLAPAVLLHVAWLPTVMACDCHIDWVVLSRLPVSLTNGL